MLDKVYELTLTKDYCRDWGVIQAVRELIQNALDSSAPFSYEFKSDPPQEGWDSGQPSPSTSLWITSKGITLSVSTLLLGTTSKADDKKAIGSFGEGYKIALLVLTRLEYEVEVRNGDKIWYPCFRWSETYQSDLLSIQESENPIDSDSGLTFVVRGLSSSDVEEIRASCLRMQTDIGAVKETSQGQILLGQPSKLYVGDLYICDTELTYGYNIKPEYIELERDRQTVSTWDLVAIARKCWYETKQYHRIAQMILEEIPDVAYAQYDAPDDLKEECYKLFRQHHPRALIASTPTEARQNVVAGIPRSIYFGSSMYSLVSSSKSYYSEAKSRTKEKAPPYVKMLEFLIRHRSGMNRKTVDAFTQLIEHAKSEWALKGKENDIVF